MREVYERPAMAAQKGRRGQSDILERHGLEASTAAITRRLDQIRSAKRSRVVVERSDPAADSTGLSPTPAAEPWMAEPLEVVLDHLSRLAPPRLSAEGRRFRSIRLAAQRAMFRVTRPYWFQQRQLYTELVGALGQLLAAVRHQERRTETLEAEIGRLANVFDAGLGKLTQKFVVGTRELMQAHNDVRSTLERRTDALEAELGRLRAASEMLDANASARPFCLGFEEIVRVPETLVRKRQRAYLPLLKNRDRVLDVGCGRGEMLDLLREALIPGLGIDIDPDMVRHCRAKGHTVEQVEAVRFLREQPEGSLSAVFTAQLIEHLPLDDLRQFLTLCRTRLMTGGVLIAETVNPHSLEAFKTIYADLTHQRPIFPEAALALCQLAGFEQPYVMFPLGSGDLDRDRQSQGEYAVVSTVGA